MATLTPLYTAPPITDATAIAAFLATHGVAFETWSMPAEALALGEAPALDDAGKTRLLELLADRLAAKADSDGYRSADVVAIRPELPGVDDALARFDKVHFHDDDEVRAIVGGEGIFGFIADDGRQFLLHMVPGEYVSLPRGMWHWFYCTSARHVTALRLFRENPSWVPHYRDTARGGATGP